MDTHKDKAMIPTNIRGDTSKNIVGSGSHLEKLSNERPKGKVDDQYNITKPKYKKKGNTFPSTS